MIFTLEALQAKHGDSLLLHYGDADDPRLIVIDGGPAGVWKRLRARLEELRTRRVPDGGPLPIRMMMVSHIDDDHINGLLGLTDHLLEQRNEGKEPYRITTFWHNAFDAVVRPPSGPAEATVASVQGASADEIAAEIPRLSHEAQLVLASVPQGQRLRNNVRALGINSNAPFDGLVRLDGQPNPVRVSDDLSFTVVGPAQAQIQALQESWAKEAKEALDRGASPQDMTAITAAYVDQSAANLSSIVVLAEMGGKRMLLTGDARGDHVLEGLEALGLLDGDGRLHVDLLKVPHHGSEHNVEQAFFERVTADHYVISADGRHHNPDVAMLEMLSKAREGASYTVHLTNRVPDAADFLDSDSARKGYDVVYRDDDALSIRVDLLSPLTD